MIAKLVLLCGLAAYASAIVCQQDVCAAANCMALTAENCKGVIKQNGGWCGCCDACITQLAEGDRCNSLFLFGVPATSECAEGLACDTATHTCKPKIVKRDVDASRGASEKERVQTCAEALTKVEDRLAASQYPLLGLEKPHCDADGNYAGMQFAGSQAYCVFKNGTSIPGYMVNRWETGKDMNCQCARDLYHYMETGLIGKLFHCAPNGNYANTQCMGSVCYCVDHNGNQVGTSTVNIGSMDSLNC